MAAVGRSTSLVRLTATGADETSNRSCTELLTAGRKRLVAVTVIVSLTPGLAAPGIATRASREAALPGVRGTGPVSSESPAPSRPSPSQSRYSITGHPRADMAVTVKESGPLPRFVRVCANTTAVPAAPMLKRGGRRATPATRPTRKTTVSEATTYDWGPASNASVAPLRVPGPPGGPSALPGGAARR